MDHPKRFSELPEYAFPRLRALLDGITPGGDPIAMSLGEPQHPFPDFVGEVIAQHTAGLAKYPPNDGLPELRGAIATWLSWRYALTGIDPDIHVLPLNGTREGLFNSAIALSPETKNGQKPVVLLPNPFYQCYAVAALTAGAEPIYVSASSETGFLPDFAALDPALLDRTTIVYMCSPSNPQGAVADTAYWTKLLELAEHHDFVIFADECYSEIYRDTPPTGAMEVAQQIGSDPERLLAFHSLSKRSNLPGMRSGFVAGGAKAIKALKQLRNYAGAPMPLPHQHAAVALWQDEEHVVNNRALYGEKFVISDHILGNISGYNAPQAGFFLWLKVDDGENATLELWKKFGVKVLPGEYLSRDDPHDNRENPGRAYIRAALVAPNEEVVRGLTAIRTYLD